MARSTSIQKKFGSPTGKILSRELLFSRYERADRISHDSVWTWHPDVHTDCFGVSEPTHTTKCFPNRLNDFKIKEDGT